MNNHASGLPISGQKRGESDFAAIPDTQDDVHGWGPSQLYPPNTEVFHQDTPANAVYLIERGLVKLSWVGADGQEMILGLRRRHWVAGAPSALLESHFTFTATTLMRCSLRCISVKGFLRKVNAEPDFCRRLLRMLSEGILSQGMKVAALGCMPARDRLEGFLRELILEQEPAIGPAEQHKPMKLQIPLKLKELAQLIAIAPEYLSRLLRDLERQKIIRRDKGWLIMTDPCKFLSGRKQVPTPMSPPIRATIYPPIRSLLNSRSARSGDLDKYQDRS
jgi:CRP-like cAMP-binding protein